MSQETISEFIALTNASKQQAIKYLSESNNNVNAAADKWFDRGEKPEPIRRQLPETPVNLFIYT